MASLSMDYLVGFAAGAFENIQSEFLQLLCQVGLLTWLLFRGSPQSRDSLDRLERKVDEIRSILKIRDGAGRL